MLQEQQYIKSEAKRQFRVNQHTSSPVDLDKQVCMHKCVHKCVHLHKQWALVNTNARPCVSDC